MNATGTMRTHAETAQDTSGKRSRASQACKECNARRIRCNVTQMQPCSGCVSRGTPCILAPSKRGRYQRNVTSQRQSKRQSVLLARSPSISHPSALEVEPSPHRNTNTDELGEPSLHSVRPPLKNGDVFYGESSGLTDVGTSVQASPAATHQNEIQTRGASPSTSNGPDTEVRSLAMNRSISDNATAKEQLQNQGAFDFPDPRECASVLQAYFSWFHPCFPVLDRCQTSEMYLEGKLSPLLLQGMLFVGVAYSSKEVVQRMGYKDTGEARQDFYRKARALYNAEWESQRFTVLQTVFLLSFVRAQPFSVYNVRHWLGVAITLAQELGLHRSTKYLQLYQNQAKVRRRLWWSLYIRDRQSSASLGQPMRISDKDCDVEIPSSSDFTDSLEQGSTVATTDFAWLIGRTLPEHAQYFLNMIELTRTLGTVLETMFTPENQSSENRQDRALNSLNRFKQVLPDISIIGQADNESSDVCTCLLHLQYNYLLILRHRHAFVRSTADTQESTGHAALQAACQVSRIVEDMLSYNLIRYGQMHAITSLFAALCIHTIDLQRSQGVRRNLAEGRAKLCLLGLREIQKSWRISDTVLELFFQRIDETTASRLQDDDLDVVETARPASTSSQLSHRRRSSIRRTSVNDSDATQRATVSTNENSLYNYPDMSEQSNFSDCFSAFLDPVMYGGDGTGFQDFELLQRYL